MLRDLIVSWAGVSLTFHDNVIWQNRTTKKIIISFVYFSVTAVMSWRFFFFFSRICFIQRLNPTRIDFCADWNSPFVLCECMFSLRRQKRVCLQPFGSWKRSPLAEKTSGHKSDSRLVGSHIEGVMTSLFVLEWQAGARQKRQRIKKKRTYVA